MASTTPGEELLLVLQQHPSHDHPLQLLHSTNESISPSCVLCARMISTTAQAYTCKQRCETDIYYHRLCVEAPPQIDLHPLHPEHPLHLLHDRPQFRCDACEEDFYPSGSSFWCHECDFHLDIACAMSTLSDEGGYQCGKTSEQITLPLHPHPLTSFTKRHDFVVDGDCYICKGSVREDGYMCLGRLCEFVIHKECIRDLYYADGTKAPRIYHGHPLKTFLEEDMGSRTCASCGSDKSGVFIGCETCRVFYHRNCFQVPEILRYPTHNPDHTLVLFPDTGTQQQCQSCSISLEEEIYYRCTLCDFSVHVGCGFQVVAYCEEGMSAEIELSWHKHPLLLCHKSKSAVNYCSYCKEKSIGPTYVCEEKDCRLILHKRCMEMESTISQHPHHPYHPLTLSNEEGVKFRRCKACGRSIWGVSFNCNSCLVCFHVDCIGCFPTHKHNLHEHKLLRLVRSRYFECNLCGTEKVSPIFRCVACNFNLHKECIKLPKVMKNDKIHWHPLTLHDTFVEDDTGEYYCEHCEKTRDPRLGVYVCGYCKISVPRIYHIHCVFPELGKLYEKKRLSSAFQNLNHRITEKEEEVQTMEEKLKEATQKLEETRRELDELLVERNKILDEDL